MQPLTSAVEAETTEMGQATALRDSTRTLRAQHQTLLSIDPDDLSADPTARTCRARPFGIHMGP